MAQLNRQQRIERANLYNNRTYGYVQSPVRRAAQPHYPQTRPQVRPTNPQVRRRKQAKKSNGFKRFFANIILLGLLGAFAYYIMPLGFNNLTKPIFMGKNNKEITFDAKSMMFPTLNYMSNDWFMGSRLLIGAETEKPEMSTFFTSNEMVDLKNQLTTLSKAYPKIKPSIYVWDYDTGRYVDMNGDKIYASASIIKIPVLIQMFKMIENNHFALSDKMTLTNYYKASGSGNMQYMASNQEFTIDQLAKVMIQDSDNTATNMLVAKVGSMTSVNEAIRRWGLKNTYIQTWLPDLEGTNYTTAKDLTTMLYNLDNPSFLEISSREYIIDYMSKVKNNRLIQAGLGKDALFVHKTGDIGTMLGDAGIVYMPNNKKYTVVILANRPYNSPDGVNYIKNASKIIYDYMLNTK